MLRVLRSGSKRVKMLWWAIAVVTIATFIGGFIFLFGAGFNSTMQAQATGAIGTVNGLPITRADFQSALADQREAFKRNYGSEPAERDLKMIEVQTWRTLVTQRLLADQAKKEGLAAKDEEIKIAIRTSPPQAVATLPAFQTDGKFDPNKYRAALGDPNQNWAPVEEMMREQLPVRKLQERLLSSIKLAEPELREAYRDRYEKLDATVIQLAPDMTAKVTPPTDAELKQIYDQYKGRFSANPRTQLELLVQPKKFGDEEVRVARELAVSLVARARKGEDFGTLARDYSDGPGNDKGGEIGRPLSPTDFGPELAPQVAAMRPGQISDPFQDNGRFIILKYIEALPPSPTAPTGGMRVAQIVIRVRPNENSLRDQYQAMQKLRNRAGSGGLGKAAAEAGLATTKTPFYDLSNMPQQLYTVPEVADWGISAKKGAVSHVFEGIDEFVVAQVADKHAAGAPPREEIADRLRELAEMDKRVTADKPRADAIAAELAKGKSLEQAAKEKGVTPIAVEGMTRANPEPRLFAVPEIVGAMFSAPAGKVLGPLHGVNGWYFVRADRRIAANPAMYDSLKGTLSNEILTRRRQQSFFGGYLSDLRDKAKVQDLRTGDVSGN